MSSSSVTTTGGGSAAASSASQSLLSQFRFLLQENVLPTKVLFDKLVKNQQQFRTEKITTFIISSTTTANRSSNKNEEILEIKRQDFNGIVLDMIDLICHGFVTVLLSMNKNHDDNNDNLSSDGEIDEKNAQTDLQSLLEVFTDYSRVANFWNATEKARWRGAGLQIGAQQMTLQSYQQKQKQDPFFYSNASNTGNNKLMLGVTMAMEL